MVENKPGQGGSIGAAELARSAPDGYTIGGGTISSHGINATLYDKLRYDPVTSFAPITMYASQPNVLLVHPSVPANNLKEFIALLKANPNKYSFGSAGNGTSQHISGEMFKVMAGVKMQHIPYRGSGQMMPELLGGTLPVAVDNIATAVPHIKAGKLRALAVTTRAALGRRARRADHGRVRPRGLRAELVAGGVRTGRHTAADRRPALHRDREDPEDARGAEAPHRTRPRHLSGMPPAELGALVKADVPRLGKIVKDSGAKAD